MDDYVAPELTKNAYNCPHCGAYAQQQWQELAAWNIRVWASRCVKCAKPTIWYVKRMVFPSKGTAPHPHGSLPEGIMSDYEEARGILAKSPRGAAALLRLCIQKLCDHLGEKGKSINDAIGSLVKKGLDPDMQKALDIVRVIGNEAVHPGQIDLNDNPTIATRLFEVVNYICEQMIARPKKLEELYAELPESKIEGIEKRDGAAGEAAADA